MNPLAPWEPKGLCGVDASGAVRTLHMTDSMRQQRNEEEPTQSGFDGSVRGIVSDAIRTAPLLASVVLIASGAFYALSSAKSDMTAVIIGVIAFAALVTAFVARWRRIG